MLTIFISIRIIVEAGNRGGAMPREKVGDERKEQILSAFEACVLRNGLAKTTLQAVADEARLPRSLVRYFVGNKPAMATLLIDRMSERAEHDLACGFPAGYIPSFDELIAFVIDGAFTNKTSNKIIAELWYLSEKNEQIKQHLALLYGRLQQQIVDAMKTENIGKTTDDRTTFARVVMSLAYGQACFEDLAGVIGKSATKRMVNAMLQSIK
ncbi:MAG: AcrR family transcriptional regulator [Paraglaciecola psychrophila]|jgi:AcrR family transcriptional regulator